MFERNKQMTSGKNSKTGYASRPATKNDKWCRQVMPKWYQDETGDKTNIGNIVTVPCIEDGTITLGGIGGFIVRSKKIGEMFLIQVVPNKKKPEYTIVFEEHERPDGTFRTQINIKREYKNWYWPW